MNFVVGCTKGVSPFKPVMALIWIKIQYIWRNHTINSKHNGYFSEKYILAKRKAGLTTNPIKNAYNGLTVTCFTAPLKKEQIYFKVMCYKT